MLSILQLIWSNLNKFKLWSAEKHKLFDQMQLKYIFIVLGAPLYDYSFNMFALYKKFLKCFIILCVSVKQFKVTSRFDYLIHIDGIR